MKFEFSCFVLDNESKELVAKGKRIALTKRHYDLLLILVGNANEVVSKDELIRCIWKGRTVENNSINRSVSKLRGVLTTVQPDQYFESVYGQGVRFLPEVRTKNGFNSIWLFAALSAMLLLGLLWAFTASPPVERDGQADSQSLIVVLPGTGSQEEGGWLSVSLSLFVEQLLGYSNTVSLRKYQKRGGDLVLQEYLDSQWQKSPTLRTVATNITFQGGVYSLSFTLTDNQRSVTMQTFSDRDLSTAFRLGCEWLYQELDATYKNTDIESLIPTDSYLMELYLRGLAYLGRGEIDKSAKFFELSLTEQPGFHVARLSLAKARYRQGRQEESLALLNALSLLKLFPALEIEIGALRGNILEKQGRHEHARDLYLALIEKFGGAGISSLNEVRYNLSYTYAALTNYDLALQQLTAIEGRVSVGSNLEMLPDVLQKKGSILQKIGRTLEAKENATRAAELFTKMNNRLGAAKVYGLLGRIASHQADYVQAELQLKKALHIARSMNYKLGIGATLNELAYVAMSVGRFEKAWELNQEMERIGAEINYTAMLLASKELAIDMARLQKRWQVAKLYLGEHERMAMELGNSRSLVNNKILSLSVALDRRETGGIAELIEALQRHIDTTHEVRLQPRLDKERARFYLLTNRAEKGIPLLFAARKLAHDTADGESIIEINNIIARYYLAQDRPKETLAVLANSTIHKPTAYPYLLLKAKASALLDDAPGAIRLARQCKKLAAEMWSIEDERYLADLLGLAKGPH